MQISAVYAFTQTSNPNDALQQLEDLDRILAKCEPSSVSIGLEYACLFDKICSRWPRALQICLRILERVEEVQAFASGGGSSGGGTRRNYSSNDIAILREKAYVYLLQRQYPKAMKAYRECSKKDGQSVASLEGLILCQIYEGQVDDAEAQLELLSAMHGESDITPQIKYVRSL